jgi:LysM repeat protein
MSGLTLSDVERSGVLSPAEGVTLVRNLAIQLVLLHRRGEGHGYLHPDIVTVDGDSGERVRVKPGAPGANIEDADYRATELNSGGAVTPRTDVYALGAMLRGLALPSAASDTDQSVGEGGEQLSPIETQSNRLIPGLRDVVNRALAPAPAHRYADADALVAALDSLPIGAAPRVEDQGGEGNGASAPDADPSPRVTLDLVFLACLAALQVVAALGAAGFVASNIEDPAAAGAVSDRPVTGAVESPTRSNPSTSRPWDTYNPVSMPTESVGPGVTVSDFRAENRLLSSTNTNVEDQRSEVPRARPATPTTHTVVHGDTLTAVARKYRVAASVVLKWNGLDDPEHIEIGQTLHVSPPSPNLWTTYTVVSGDSLSKIADRYRLTVGQLQTWNTLTGSVIQPGQRLRIQRTRP